MYFIFVHLNSQDCEENDKWQHFIKPPPVSHTNTAFPVSDIITSSGPTQETKTVVQVLCSNYYCSRNERIINIELQLRYSVLVGQFLKPWSSQ